MQRYSYRFRWKDGNDILRTAYMEGSSMVHAMDAFEEEYEMKIDEKVEVRRVAHH